MPIALGGRGECIHISDVDSIVEAEAIIRNGLQGNLRRLAPEQTKRALRFAGEPIEHHSLQSRDPSGNVLEFKTYTDPEAPFAPADDVRIGDVAV